MKKKKELLELILRVGTGYEDRIARSFEIQARDYVTRQQLKLLLYIKERKRVSMSELSGNKQIAKPQLTAAIQELVEDGLVSRSPDEQDRRKIYVVCTEKGEKLLEQLYQQFMLDISEKIDLLTEEEQEELIQALRTAERLLEKTLSYRI